MKLSIIIPVYNEESFIRRTIERTEKVKIKKEVIIVDDGSSDQTPEILELLKKKHNFILLTHKRNRGKGAAIKTALRYISGELTAIQDADLETRPEAYPELIEPLVNGKAEIVYGARTRSFSSTKPFILKIYFLGGTVLTSLANLLFHSRLSDINTPCKLFVSRVLKEMDLQSEGFDVDLEITAKALKNRYSLIEIPVPYFPRTIKEGKKIKIRDGVAGALALIKYRFKD